MKRDKGESFSFIPLQNSESLKKAGLPIFDKNTLSTIILIEEGKIYQLSDAALRIVRRLKFPWNLLYTFIIVPPFIRDGIYKFVSRKRYRWFGRREDCFLG
jgi:predicted DCC family thiol-disulfide oxidoreductase YuxK